MIALSTTITPDNATDRTVTWSSDHPEIATVNPTSGVVTGVAKGTATITATSNDDSTKTATKTIEVIDDHKAVTSVSLNKTSLELSTSESDTLEATVLPDDATNKAVEYI